MYCSNFAATRAVTMLMFTVGNIILERAYVKAESSPAGKILRIDAPSAKSAVECLSLPSMPSMTRTGERRACQLGTAQERSCPCSTKPIAEALRTLALAGRWPSPSQASWPRRISMSNAVASPSENSTALRCGVSEQSPRRVIYNGMPCALSVSCVSPLQY